MTTTAKQIKLTLKSLKDNRNPREAVWDDIINYILPGLETLMIQKVKNPGKRIGVKRYDGTGVSALQLFADGLFGYLISPSIAWLKLTMKEEIIRVPEVREWLQDLEAHYYEIFNQTNFYDSMSTYFEYAPALGFADMYLEEDIKKGKIVFKVYHPGGVYIKENKHGLIDTVYREELITADMAVKKFGRDNLSVSLQNAVEKNPFEKRLFVHAVFPREDYNYLKIDSLNKPYASVWLEAAGDRKDPDGKIVSEKGYDRFPHMVWRFKSGTTPYGKGPAEDALVEVLGANVIQKSLLKAAQKSIEPPLNVPAEMVGQVDLTPSGMNYYSDPDKRIYPVDRGVDFPIGIDREERIQQAIERHFKVEFFTLLSTISLREGGRRTATEIMELQGEKAAVLGRPINRLNNECLNPIIDAIFDIEMKAGRLPPMPPILEDMIGESINVDYMGPLAQAQKKMFQVQGISQGLEQLGALAQVKPEALDWINEDNTAKTILTIAGYPQDCMNDEAKVKKIREVRATVQAQETAKEDLMNVAKATGDIAKAGDMMGEGMPGGLGGTP
jgi:hypothetical protein